MGCLSKHSFAAPARKIERVDLPEFGADAHVFVRELGAKALHELRQTYATPAADAFFDFEYDLLARVLVDDKGEPIFKDKQELCELTDFSVTMLQSLAKKALELFGIGNAKN